MSSNKLITIGAITAATTAVIGYCLYFDYNRRKSPEFRRKLKKNAKKYKKLQIEKEEIDKKAKFVSIRDKLTQSLTNEPLPLEMEEKQSYFLQQVTLGEQLAVSPNGEEDSLICFYKALAVYPQPADLLTIFQKSVPEKIYELIVFLIAVQPPLSLANILSEDFISGDVKIIETENIDDVQ